MNESRRTLLKGMLAGAVLGAVGLPRLSMATESMVVLQQGTPMDATFLADAQVAATASGWVVGTATIPLRGGIVDPVAARAFLQARRGVRVTGLMDDASYVPFSALARDAGAALVAEDRHGQYARLVSFVIDL